MTGLMAGLTAGLISISPVGINTTVAHAAEVVTGATFSGNYLAGRHAQAVRDTRSAAVYLGVASQFGPENIELLRRAYVMALSEGAIDDAVDYIKRVQKLGGTAPLSRELLAAVAIKQGKFKDVGLLFDGEFTGISAVLGPVLTAWALAGTRDFKTAIQALSSMKSNEGSNAYVHLHMGLISSLAGDDKAAEKYYLMVRKEAGLSMRLAQHLGGLYERTGKQGEAKAIYEAFDLQGESDDLWPPAKVRIKSGKPPKAEVNSAARGAAEAIFGIASSLNNQGGLESALILGRMALYLRPGFPATAIIIGGILESYDRFEEANRLYIAIPLDDALSWRSRIRVAENLDALGKEQEAVRALKALVNKREDEARAAIELGDLLRRHDRFEEAADAYSLAIERIADIGPRHWGLFYSRGIAYEQQDRWELAEADFLHALKLDPEQPFVLNYLGYSWVEKKLHLDRAIEMIKRAVELRPRDGYIVDSLGWGLYQIEDYPQAVKRLERAVLLRPEDPIINDHLGDAYWRIGRTREARFQWERALGLEPDEEDLKRIRNKVRTGLKPIP